ncbi:hypothetical protein [Salinispora oceanensis]|uniref:hypothetical protein n=1 Tax=Salinispora oceanensis TaxID=1050199 RepID=UPI000378F19E|nr:hypothetical protein [Salinispora oceanensis]
METLRFRYFLLRRPDDPTGPPANLIAEAISLGPTQAVIWDRATNAWTFRPDVAASFLWSKPEEREEHEVQAVDRATVEREAIHFTTVPLPTEAELTEICREALPRWLREARK